MGKLQVREATLADRERWDLFVDSEGGSFSHYFDWKYVYEASGYQYLPLIIENTASQLIGILPIVRKRKLLYSSLVSLPEGASGGFVLKRNLTGAEKYHVLDILLKYIDVNYANNCSTFTLRENLSIGDQAGDEPTTTLIDNGFRWKYDSSTQLPCTYILELRKPFEEKIWKGLWTHNLRKSIAKVARSGVVVIWDRNLDYIDQFADMLYGTFTHYNSTPPTKDAIMVRMEVFRYKTKLFVALLEGSPLAAILCHYSPSTCYLSKMPSFLESRENHLTKLLYRIAVEDACNTGYKFVEFGTTSTPSLAYWKERFKGTKIPMRIYKKKYSAIACYIEKVTLIPSAWHNRGYVWHNRHKLLDEIIHG